MAFLNLALYAEGRTDYRFLTPLLRRLTEHVCLSEARMVVEVGDVLDLDAPPAFRGADRATRIIEAARGFWGGACVLFVHADVDATDPARALAERVDPGVRLIRATLQGGDCVAVVPIRETEAWALADGDALRHAFGTTLNDAALRLRKAPRDVEDIDRPKAALNAAFEAAVSPSLRRRSRASDFYERIGERIDLGKLHHVPAFARLEDDLRRALRALGFLRHR